MGIKTLSHGKKLHITFKWLLTVFNVMFSNFLCLGLRFVWVKINKNLPKIVFIDYVAVYENSLKVGAIIHEKFTIIFAHS